MAENRDAFAALRARRDGIRTWLADEAPFASVDQRHLDANTPERAYWHLGYQAALLDTLDFLERDVSQTRNTGDTSS